ncbi:MAG TPA: DUF4430 domain-containing protein [Candidatus Paceibacterota bacterium]|nr:DUF4430 domain-containing protein [Candidatus Paceibacterota bacterium]
MKIRKQYIFTGIVLAIIFIIGFLYLNSSKKDKLPIVTEEPQILADTNLNTSNQPKQSEKSTENSTSIKTPDVSPNVNNVKVFLTVDGKKYETNIKEGSSVFDAMEKMKNESVVNNPFDFKYKSNSSMGNFITEINGQYGTPGKYWIYYVNNKKASIGVSNYILKEGDIINWAQEGI